MRILLDHELVTMREAQQFLQISRSEINHLIKSGRLKGIRIGSQYKIEGWSIKSLMAGQSQTPDFNGCSDQQFFVNASNSELSMIADWT